MKCYVRSILFNFDVFSNVQLVQHIMGGYVGGVPHDEHRERRDLNTYIIPIEKLFNT